jgi:hypothetical protein
MDTDFDDWAENYLVFDDDDDVTDALWYRNGAVVLLICGILGNRYRIKRLNYRRSHLVRANLMPNPRDDSPWKALYQSHDDHAFITTMSMDTRTFEYLLDRGFRDAWDSRPVARNDIDLNGFTRLGRRSLDAEGGLGLLLHHLCSTMNETGLQQILDENRIGE